MFFSVHVIVVTWRELSKLAELLFGFVLKEVQYQCVQSNQNVFIQNMSGLHSFCLPHLVYYSIQHLASQMRRS